MYVSSFTSIYIEVFVFFKKYRTNSPVWYSSSVGKVILDAGGIAWFSGNFKELIYLVGAMVSVVLLFVTSAIPDSASSKLDCWVVVDNVNLSLGPS